MNIFIALLKIKNEVINYYCFRNTTVVVFRELL